MVARWAGFCRKSSTKARHLLKQFASTINTIKFLDKINWHAKIVSTTSFPSAHFYIFSDGCPSDWLNSDHPDVWRVLANYTFQTNPLLKDRIDNGEAHEIILQDDEAYASFIKLLTDRLKNYSCLQKWKQSNRYKHQFCKSFIQSCKYIKPIIAAGIYTADTLRSSQQALLNEYNKKLGGIEGCGIGFERFIDGTGRTKMKHSFLNFNGCHEIEFLEDQGLLLLFISWFIADQYVWHKRGLEMHPESGYGNLEFTFVSDKLSGDNDTRRPMERCLQLLIDPEENNSPIRVTRSKSSDTFSGDLLADNLAGWVQEAVSRPTEKFASYIKDSDSALWQGCHVLLSSESRLEARSLLSYLADF